MRAASRHRIPAHAVRSNLEGVYALPPPPEGFNPLTASNTTLRRYGIPPRPDPKRSPQGLQAWGARSTGRWGLRRAGLRDWSRDPTPASTPPEPGGSDDLQHRQHMGRVRFER
jgi:hypothetical protein